MDIGVGVWDIPPRRMTKRCIATFFGELLFDSRVAAAFEQSYLQVSVVLRFSAVFLTSIAALDHATFSLAPHTTRLVERRWRTRIGKLIPVPSCSQIVQLRYPIRPCYSKQCIWKLSHKLPSLESCPGPPPPQSTPRHDLRPNLSTRALRSPRPDRCDSFPSFA